MFYEPFVIRGDIPVEMDSISTGRALGDGRSLLAISVLKGGEQALAPKGGGSSSPLCSLSQHKKGCPGPMFYGPTSVLLFPHWTVLKSNCHPRKRWDFRDFLLSGRK